MQVLNVNLDELLKSGEWEASLDKMFLEIDFVPEDWSNLVAQWREHNKI